VNYLDEEYYNEYDIYNMEYNNNNYYEENDYTDNEYNMYEMNYNEYNMYPAVSRRSERNKNKVMRENKDRRMQEQ
jgi:hypothetical protein